MLNKEERYSQVLLNTTRKNAIVEYYKGERYSRVPRLSDIRSSPKGTKREMETYASSKARLKITPTTDLNIWTTY